MASNIFSTGSALTIIFWLSQLRCIPVNRYKICPFLSTRTANIGPPLIGMRERFKDRELLRQQIWDAANRNPHTIMPPFGRHMILTDDEIDLIVDYVLTL